MDSATEDPGSDFDMPYTPRLDHLVLFLPYDPISKGPLIPPAFAITFPIVPGGTHADNLTANALIPLADGCYIELICFLPQPESRKRLIEKHWWGPDAGRKGWTDWCLTTIDYPAGQNIAASNAYVQLKHLQAYDDPVAGGRQRPDGVEVHWNVTFPRPTPEGRTTRGEIPFWCHDVTPRTLRVPSPDLDPSPDRPRILGVLALTVIVGARKEFERLREIYSVVLGEPRVSGEDFIEFQLSRVHNVDGLDNPTVFLKLGTSGYPLDQVSSTGRGFGFGEVVLAAETTGNKEPGTVERIDGTDGFYLGGVRVQYI